MSTARWNQAFTVAVIDMRRMVGQRRVIGLVVLAAIPICLTLLRAVFLPDGVRLDVNRAATELATVFYVLQLRFVVFFGCAFVFVRSLRGEILDRSLHFALLAPVRREVLAVGKYLGAVAVSSLVLVCSTFMMVVLMYLAHGVGPTIATLGSVKGLSHLASYVFATLLACIGYGAIFFLAGMFFRSPMVPAAVYLGFELVAPYLGPTIGAFSMARHFRALLPVHLSLGPFDAAVTTPAWLATLGLLAVSVAALTVAAFRARSLEVTYAGDD